MKRKWGGLSLPIERSILRILAERETPDSPGIHGYEMARLLTDEKGRDGYYGRSRLAANGTVYKALRRLRQCHALTDRWEDPDVALAACRPRRLYFRLTDVGRGRALRLDALNRLQARIEGRRAGVTGRTGGHIPVTPHRLPRARPPSECCTGHTARPRRRPA